MLLAFIQCLRPKQWTKNVLVLAGIVFAQRYDEPRLVFNAALAFAVFCALSGVVYIVNDIADVAQDRQHPKKRKRPIAAGRIDARAAAAGAVLLTLASLLVSLALLPFNFLVLAIVYLALVSAYSFHLKHMVLMDILILAVGFVIRALAGVEAIAIDPSNPVPVTSYFLLTTLFLALFLATAKRRSEIVNLGDSAADHRKVLGDYSREFLDTALTIATAGTIFSYALWTTQGQFAETSRGEPSYLMALTMPFVVYGLLRYLWLAYRQGEGGEPEQLLLSDRPLLGAVLLWVLSVAAILLTLK